MKFTKTWKRFWTLNRHHAAGFTLVELIVVIAILAILAGIAIPAYSGYINKAKEAGDQTLLSAVNTAFAAACIENRVDTKTVPGTPDVELVSGADGGLVVAGITGVDDEINASFAVYFGTNSASEFKVITDLRFDRNNGVFTDDDDDMVTLTYTDGNGNAFTISVTQAQADALKNNNLSALGSGVLLGKVDDVSNIASSLIAGGFEEGAQGNVLYDLIFDEKGVYLSNLQQSLGLEGKDEEFAALVQNPDGSFNTEVLGNSLLLSAAQNTQGMDTSFLGQTGSAAALRNELNNPATAEDAMAKLALTYGMYTAYVNSEAGKNAGMTDESADIIASGNFTGMTSVLATLESKEFNDYLASDEGKADLNAYMSSMEIVNNSASSGAGQDILLNGFDNDQLGTLLGGLMGEEK